jgi:hypothetical protein
MGTYSLPMLVHSAGVTCASARHDEQTRHSRRGALLAEMTLHTASRGPCTKLQNISAMISRGSRLNGKVECDLAVALSIAFASSISSVMFPNSRKSSCFASKFVRHCITERILASSQGMFTLGPDMSKCVRQTAPDGLDII